MLLNEKIVTDSQKNLQVKIDLWEYLEYLNEKEPYFKIKYIKEGDCICIYNNDNELMDIAYNVIDAIENISASQY